MGKNYRIFDIVFLNDPLYFIGVFTETDFVAESRNNKKSKENKSSDKKSVKRSGTDF